jgi:hypothetical protein
VSEQRYDDAADEGRQEKPKVFAHRGGKERFARVLPG